MPSSKLSSTCSTGPATISPPPGRCFPARYRRAPRQAAAGRRQRRQVRNGESCLSSVSYVDGQMGICQRWKERGAVGARLGLAAIKSSSQILFDRAPSFSHPMGRHCSAGMIPSTRCISAGQERSCSSVFCRTARSSCSRASGRAGWWRRLCCPHRSIIAGRSCRTMRSSPRSSARPSCRRSRIAPTRALPYSERSLRVATRSYLGGDPAAAALFRSPRRLARPEPGAGTGRMARHHRCGRRHARGALPRARTLLWARCHTMTRQSGKPLTLPRGTPSS